MRVVLVEVARLTGPPHSPYRAASPAPQASLVVGRRMFALCTGSATDDVALIEAAERLCTCLPEGLARWFGPDGSVELVARALAISEARHPALGPVEVSRTPSPRLVGIAASAQSHGAAATADGVVTLLATLDELLGRLIGPDMTLVLLEQCATTAAADKPAKHEVLPHMMNEQ